MSVRIGTLEVPALPSRREGVSTRSRRCSQPGSYDVKVTLGDGRTAVRPGGLTVCRGGVAGWATRDPIGRSGAWSLHADGARDRRQRGGFPRQRAPGRGRRQHRPARERALRGRGAHQQVVVDSIQSDVFIRVTDIAGHVGKSNTFLLQ